MQRSLSPVFFCFLLATLVWNWQSANAQLYVGGYSTVGEYNLTTGAAINSQLIPPNQDYVQGLALSGNNLFVSSYYLGTVGVYNATTGAAINSSLVTNVQNPWQIAVSGNVLYVAESGKIATYNATTGASINPNLITLVAGSYFTLSGNTIYATNFGNNVSEFNASTGATINANFITGMNSPYGLAVWNNTLFVMVDGGQMVNGYDATTGALTRTNVLNGSQDDEILLVSGNDLFAASYGTGTVSEYDAATGAPINAKLVYLPPDGVFSIAVATPEPGSMALLTLGIASLLGFRRRRC